MKELFAAAVLLSLFVATGCGGGGGDCTPHASTLCQKSLTYWTDSCGNLEEVKENCDCGCNYDHTECMVKNCTGKECGDDGCGGTCPPGCGAGENCNEVTGQCEFVCTPDCAGKECGPDGCGSTCAPGCGAGETCNNGVCEVITDSIWQDPPAASSMNWQEAIDYCNNLTLDGHDDWRLPTISELRSLIRGCPATETGGSCGVTDSCLSHLTCWTDLCNGCLQDGGPAGGCYWPDGMQGTCSWYWSSSSSADNTGFAWFVNFDYGSVDGYDKVFTSNARCVRPGS